MYKSQKLGVESASRSRRQKLAGESFGSSIARHEYYLAMRLGLKPSDRVLDCGCGIGGPLRNIGRFSGAFSERDAEGATRREHCDVAGANDAP